MCLAQITLWLISLTVMITTGAICISEVLGKCSLQVLDMCNNNIGDDGITAIAGTLSNSQISELQISRCGITLTGARSLAAGLLVNNSVRIFIVWDNPITVEGARLILQSAMDSGVCEQVYINEDYRDDDEVKKMMIILEQRQQVGGCVVMVIIVVVTISGHEVMSS